MTRPSMTRPDAAPVRPGEELPLEGLRGALRGQVAGDVDALQVLQFPGGFSNLTYLLRLGEQEYVLRRAPLGPVAKGAHDMAREYRLLEKIAPVFPAAPRPALLVEDTIEVPVQVNGKVRARLTLAAGLSAADLEAAARADAKVTELLAGATVRKVIVRAPKLVNIVV